MEEDFNNKFFPESERDPEEQEREEALHEANLEGWKKGVTDGYIDGHEAGRECGREEMKRAYEKSMKEFTAVSILITTVACISCVFLGSWAERKWGKGK